MKSIVIAKIDGTQNEIDDVHLHEYPTFKLFPKGKDKLARAVDYNVATDGDRTAKNFAGFLRHHTRKAKPSGESAPSGSKDSSKTTKRMAASQREEL